jgi:protein TonB
MESIRPVVLLISESENLEESSENRRARQYQPSAPIHHPSTQASHSKVSEKTTDTTESPAMLPVRANLADNVRKTEATTPANLTTGIAGNGFEQPANDHSATEEPRTAVVSPVNHGSGLSQGDRGLTMRFAQASYVYSPKPDYPEQARKEGKDGRVLLRVLVDQDGKTQSVQVSSSSGSEALDYAAAEAIKRWRFSPARYGDEPVASWVRIPIVFRLTEP